ncbi:MAG TPA: histidine kinase dimerization/phospho-acceptor domain-containing protein [Thermoanaerobaculia bacterium]|jgi:signal transduction histidine kinase|nr:histidine kinase dimerization/phospho-acceptor domain-containing protein [Thermoanaerobaculia bacterium]
MESWLERFARTIFLRSADTAHDLKTPLNVAVLNLELLRIRLSKITGGAEDEKMAAYAAAIETELRRMASIVDAFFLLSTPPKDEGEPAAIDLAPLAEELAGSAGIQLRSHGPARCRVHEIRMRHGLKLFFEGAARFLKSDARDASTDCAEGCIHVAVRGQPQHSDVELSKLFKFYYTDASGRPDLSLATARLIVETYGGELKAFEERDNVTLRFSVPQEIDETSSNR